MFAELNTEVEEMGEAKAEGVAGWLDLEVARSEAEVVVVEPSDKEAKVVAMAGVGVPAARQREFWEEPSEGVDSGAVEAPDLEAAALPEGVRVEAAMGVGAAQKVKGK